MIEVERLSFGYPRGALIFADFSWRVERGDAWAVLGPSGCGKSTLLSLLAGLLKPAGGQICIDGQPLLRPRPQTGLIIQDYGLLPWASVRENASLGLRVRSFYGPDGIHAPREDGIDRRQPQSGKDVQAWLERLGLLEVAGQFPGRISGGQRQRTAIARTLALQPDLLLMDEPFSSLDAPTREGLQRLTLELWAEQGLTLLLVTHAIEEAAVLGQKILLLGKIPPPCGRGEGAREAQVLENPGVTRADYRESEEYHALCRELRRRLGDGL
jgi:ABC-type nitrate/sulfonate/bicarbonate transport system ATPase subunit